jgi:hypothetical protein
MTRSASPAWRKPGGVLAFARFRADRAAAVSGERTLPIGNVGVTPPTAPDFFGFRINVVRRSNVILADRTTYIPLHQAGCAGWKTQMPNRFGHPNKKEITMTFGKTLMLAAVAALSLGAGAASAQNLSPGGYEAPYAGARNSTAPAKINAGADAGSSDVMPTHSTVNHVAPVPVGVPNGGNG